MICAARLISILILSVFFEIVAFLLFSGRVTLVLSLDKESDRLTIKMYRFFKRWQIFETPYALSNIEKFAVKVTSSAGSSPDGYGGGGSSSGLIIKYKSGNEVSIANTFDSRGKSKNSPHC